MGGMHPVVAIYATFLNRAFDQVLMDVAHAQAAGHLRARPGRGHRAGRGQPPRHVGRLDPADRAGHEDRGPAGRHPAGRAAARGRGGQRRPDRAAVPARHGRRRRSPAVGKLGGMDVLASAGRRGRPGRAAARGRARWPRSAVEVAERLADQGIGVTVVDPRWVKPVDEALADAARRAPARGHRRGQRPGRAGSATPWPGCCATTTCETPVAIFGLPQRFLEHGERGEILAEAGPDPAAPGPRDHRGRGAPDPGASARSARR